MKNRISPLAAGIGAIVVAVVVAGVIVVANGHKSNSSDTDMSTMNMSSTQHDHGGTATNAQATATDQVSIQNYAFGPTAITVKAGTKVTWTNQDDVKHTVTINSGEGPKSDLFGRGESYSYTFAKPGTYQYHCTPHAYMKGTVIVTQ